MVEVDSSYYAIPSAANAQLCGERTRVDFVFNVKAFRLFTGHQTDPKVMGKDIIEALPAGLAAKKTVYYRELLEQAPAVLDELWRRFFLALSPLHDAGKLCAVHSSSRLGSSATAMARPTSTSAPPGWAIG
jgi:uncharacterized protein YecE (DUF72 family)